MPLFPGLIAIAATSCAPQAPGGGREDFDTAREQMVVRQIEARGVKDVRTLAAMRRVARHLFVPAGSARDAYEDRPLPIGHDQTISQPYIVAFMTEALRLQGDEKVLEIGTGSGYQAAVLGEIVPRVFTIEIVKPLADEAAERLRQLGYRHVSVRAGDGYEGWPEEAPFDAIMVTAAAPSIPEPLKRQLKQGGRLILPVGDEFQELVVVTRRGEAFVETRVLPVRFVPMTGRVRE